MRRSLLRATLSRRLPTVNRPLGVPSPSALPGPCRSAVWNAELAAVEARASRRTSAEYWFDRIAGDLPWGVLIFAAVAVGGLVWSLSGQLDPGAYLAAVASGSGLLAVGHGIRTHARGRYS